MVPSPSASYCFVSAASLYVACTAHETSPRAISESPAMTWEASDSCWRTIVAT
ncbi:hypothetical protein OAN61_00660 [bacterium]|nr:hypothetical protein [bacterium]